ncbi:MAG: hypothetical protein AAGA56_22670, partial [Myxococcota bacterium]
DIPVSPKEKHPEVPDELDAICRKALAIEPDDRYETAEQFQHALEEYIERHLRPPTQREVGRLCSQLFAKERKQIKEIVEGQLAKIKDEPAVTLEPVLIPDRSLSSSTLEGSLMAPVSSGPEVSAASSTGAVTETIEKTTPTSVSGDGHPGGMGLEMTATNLAVQRRGTPTTIVASAGLVLVGAGLFYLMNRTGPTAERPTPITAPQTPVSPASDPTPNQPTTARMTKITLAAEPASAQFRIDRDGWILENPFVGEYPMDGREHIVEVKAIGYEPVEFTVMFNTENINVPTKKLTKLGGEQKPRPVVRHYPRPLPRGVGKKPVEPARTPSPAAPEPTPPPKAKAPEMKAPKAPPIDTIDPWTQ